MLKRAGMWLSLCAVAATATAAGCGRRDVRRPDTSGAVISRLELVGQYHMEARPNGDALAKARLGGVSGLTVDPISGEILGISDDAEDNRFFVFRIGEPAIPFRMDLRAYVPLPSGPGAPAALDSEGIALTRSGRLFVSSEGLPQRTPRVPPAVVEYTRRPGYVGPLTIPAKFLQPSSGPLDRGVRSNEGFEALTVTPDERRLFTASETSLVQDGEGATFERGTTARILEFVATEGKFVAGREFPYPLDPVPQAGFTPHFVINGLVELLALTDTEFLSMDRAYAQETQDGGRRAAWIRIYRTSIAGATDISMMDSIRGRTDLRPARKQLLVDIGKVAGLDPALAVPELDNFEGLALGPTLADGSRTLLVVSDDNFSPLQRTWFLLFRIVQ